MGRGEGSQLEQPTRRDQSSDWNSLAADLVDQSLVPPEFSAELRRFAAKELEEGLSHVEETWDEIEEEAREMFEAKKLTAAELADALAEAERERPAERVYAEFTAVVIALEELIEADPAARSCHELGFSSAAALTQFFNDASRWLRDADRRRNDPPRENPAAATVATRAFALARQERERTLGSVLAGLPSELANEAERSLRSDNWELESLGSLRQLLAQRASIEGPELAELARGCYDEAVALLLGQLAREHSDAVCEQLLGRKTSELGLPSSQTAVFGEILSREDFAEAMRAFPSGGIGDVRAALEHHIGRRQQRLVHQAAPTAA